MQERVDGYRDQGYAKLFLECEWSQEDLAEYLGKRWGKSVTQQWVAYHLRLGRFLQFFTTSGCEKGLKLAKHFTERAFRSMWESTEAGGEYGGRAAHTMAAQKDEERRFEEIVKLMEDGYLCRPKKHMKEAIIKRVAQTLPRRASTMRTLLAAGTNDTGDRRGPQATVRQEDLAEYLTERWGVSVSEEWVGKNLRLGRFLTFFRTSGTEKGLRLAKHCAGHATMPRRGGMGVKSLPPTDRPHKAYAAVFLHGFSPNGVNHWVW